MQEPRSGCLALGEIQAVANVAPRLVGEPAPGGVPVDPPTTFTRADEHGSMLGQAGDAVVDAVDLVQDSIRIRVVFCCPWHVTLQVSYRTACRVRAALTGNQRGVGGEDFKAPTCVRIPGHPSSVWSIRWSSPKGRPLCLAHLAGVTRADLTPYTASDCAVSSGSHAAMSDSSLMALFSCRFVVSLYVNLSPIFWCTHLLTLLLIGVII